MVIITVDLQTDRPARVDEPLVTFYHAVTRPVWDQLERAKAAPRVWQARQHAFVANVLGPPGRSLAEYRLIAHEICQSPYGREATCEG